LHPTALSGDFPSAVSKIQSFPVCLEAILNPILLSEESKNCKYNCASPLPEAYTELRHILAGVIFTKSLSSPSLPLISLSSILIEYLPLCAFS